jgi:two-component system sensor histidine kinase/response regulator
MAHSLKGVAGNVGAVELYELMIDLEKALRDNERAQIPSLLEKARAAMKKVLTAIEGYIADNESDASEDGTDRIMGRNELLQKFEKLSELLADDDASALRFVETFSHAVPSEIRPDMSKLVDQIQAFDFDEASRIVQQASNALKSDEE